MVCFPVGQRSSHPLALVHGQHHEKYTISPSSGKIKISTRAQSRDHVTCFTDRRA